MAKGTTAGVAKTNLVTQIRGFFDEVWAEMQKVTWPTQADLKSSTTIVLMLLLIMGAITFVFDACFNFMMALIFRLS